MEEVSHRPGDALVEPCIALCNFINDNRALKDFAAEHGFGGVDWSLESDALPETPAAASRWVRSLAALEPLEVRFHCPFAQMDLGHADEARVNQAVALFNRVIRLVSKAGGRYLTLHVGLGHDTTRVLSWQRTVDNLRRLVQTGAAHGMTVCLENLLWGWTSKPNLFEKLIRHTGAGVTLDLGHAYGCEAVQSRQFEVADFITPHAGRIFNAHVYHTEVPGVGHLPPETADDLADRLQLLETVGCRWWTIEIREPAPLLKTRQIIADYFNARERQGIHN
jgi:sugar phosphate isomerase/epimerase